MRKGIFFLGDSFTWGQGLHYYSNLPNINYRANTYDKNDITTAHLKFIESNRFANLVATHFNTFYEARKANGGHNEGLFDEMIKIIKDEKYFFEDFDYLIIQFTSIFRDNFKLITDDGTEYILNGISINAMTENKIIFDYVNRHFSGKFKNFIDHFYKTKIEYYIKRLKDIEAHGIKVFGLCWPAELVEYLKNYEYFSDKLITIDYNGVSYTNFENLMNEQKLDISNDIWFKENNLSNPIDGHLSFEGHKIVANAVINKIQNYEQSRVHPVQKRINICNDRAIPTRR